MREDDVPDEDREAAGNVNLELPEQHDSGRQHARAGTVHRWRSLESGREEGKAKKGREGHRSTRNEIPPRRTALSDGRQGSGMRNGPSFCDLLSLSPAGAGVRRWSSPNRSCCISDVCRFPMSWSCFSNFLPKPVAIRCGLP